MSTTVEKAKTVSDSATSAGPIIIDLGKRKKKDIKNLRDGSGKLIDEVSECIEELVASGSCPKDAQPIILIVREKQKSTLPFLFGK